MEAIQELLRQLEDKLRNEANNRETNMKQDVKDSVESIKEDINKNLVSNTSLYNQMQEMRVSMEKEREAKDSHLMETMKELRKDNDEKVKRIGRR